ncbi:TetR/AcrR family transcriptional regulator [Acetobacterium bakii]|uniref:HTH tetR-type domain-containing protein n=1 Tax=Acetobacterium bakii TaxID=52689 RepID=A0A0L6TX49_9FIRM|nr:TetR/AcrR family transcriptional regulator [Acetobacterium bakii]KNZ40657.1 hypothetical protein AKG39_16445 [Acetobacterium bakii]
MYLNFYKLDKEKQKRIINSALQVFAINDFKHASTDDIAARAKISKGSLFQHLSMSAMYEQLLRIYDFYKRAVYKDEYLLGEQHDEI